MTVHQSKVEIEDLRELIRIKNAQLSECTRVMREVAMVLSADGMHALAGRLFKARAGKETAPIAPRVNAFEAYREAARRTRGTLLNTGLTHAALGLAGEAGELVDAVKKDLFYNLPLLNAQDRVREEAGDVLFFLDWVAACFDLTLQEIANANIAKLKARYPNGFTTDGGIR